MRNIDLEKLEKIQARYRVANPGNTPAKYLELRAWLEANPERDGLLHAGAERIF